MSIVVGIASREGPDKNPHIKRCLGAMESFEAGVAMELRLEISPILTRGEKRQRVFSYAQARGADYVVILEDDTEIVEDHWLYHLVYPMIVGFNVGLVNPSELRHGDPVPPKEGRGPIIEVPTAYGFCMAYHMGWEPQYDPSISYLDDLAMSLACRAQGFRVARSGQIFMRHTKQPFASDDTPPWQQADRARWGEGDRYYDAEMFHRKRVHEAALLVDKYGDMAIDHLPHELINDLPVTLTFKRREKNETESG